MNKDTKYIIGILFVFILLIIGVAVWASVPSPGSNGPGTVAAGGDRYVNNAQAEGISADIETIDIGQVGYGNGLVTKTYQLKNETDRDLKLKKIITSCMCTKAKVKFTDKTTKYYSMEMNGDKNPIISYDFPAGSTAELEFIFDPAAHGPAGIGPVDRVITLYFDNGYKEFKFNGEVVK